MKTPLVIYHANCRDGFCAVWVASLHFSYALIDVEYLAALHGTPPPDVTGRDVFILDFAYKRPDMERMQATANRLIVLDHHKTAQEALEGLGPDVHFDMKRSGASMAWDYFFPSSPRPWLVSYVEDRDLWRNQLPDSAAVNAFIGTMPFDFLSWTEQYLDDRREYERTEPPYSVQASGEAVLRKVTQYVSEVSKNVIVSSFSVPAVLEPYIVPVINAPQVDISELLSSIARTPIDGVLPPFALGWWQRLDGLFQYSLRSVDSFDVSAIATQYGGGGHLNAAGFQSTSLLHSAIMGKRL